MHEVLQTPELLENILLQLPIKDLLLRVPLVCKEWQASIAASPRLQQALFFKPLNGKPLRFIKRKTDAAWAESEDDPHAYTVFLNPFYFSLEYALNGGMQSRRQFDAFSHAKASWRRMLATQPASGSNMGLVKEGGHIRLGDLAKGWYGFHTSMTRIEGRTHCLEVYDGYEVRRIVRPKALWM